MAQNGFPSLPPWTRLSEFLRLYAELLDAVPQAPLVDAWGAGRPGLQLPRFARAPRVKASSHIPRGIGQDRTPLRGCLPPAVSTDSSAFSTPRTACAWPGSLRSSIGPWTNFRTVPFMDRFTSPDFNSSDIKELPLFKQGLNLLHQGCFGRPATSLHPNFHGRTFLSKSWLIIGYFLMI